MKDNYEKFHELCFGELLSMQEGINDVLEGEIVKDRLYYIVSGIPMLYRQAVLEKVVLDVVNRKKYIDFIDSLSDGSIGAGRGIYLQGKGGVGKSMASGVICKIYYTDKEQKEKSVNDFLEYRSSVWWWDYMDLLEKKARRDYSWNDFIDYIFQEKRVIVLDDFGRGYQDSVFMEGVTTLLCKRFFEKGGHLIVNSNLSIDKVSQLYSGKLLSLFERHLEVVGF